MFNALVDQKTTHFMAHQALTEQYVELRGDVAGSSLCLGLKANT